MKFLMNLVIQGMAVFMAAYLLPGIKVADFGTAIIVAVVLGLVNLFIKPVFILLTLPISLLTLGIFTLFINTFMILITSALVPGFTVKSFAWAFIFGLVLSLISSFLHQQT